MEDRSINIRLTWPEVLRLSRSTNAWEQKGSLDEARVLVIRFLESLGIEVMSGEAKAAVQQAASDGLVDRVVADRALWALKIRNRLGYDKDPVYSTEVEKAVLALHELCGSPQGDERVSPTSTAATQPDPITEPLSTGEGPEDRDAFRAFLSAFESACIDEYRKWDSVGGRLVGAFFEDALREKARKRKLYETDRPAYDREIAQAEQRGEERERVREEGEARRREKEIELEKGREEERRQEQSELEAKYRQREREASANLFWPLAGVIAALCVGVIYLVVSRSHRPQQRTMRKAEAPDVSPVLRDAETPRKFEAADFGRDENAVIDLVFGRLGNGWVGERGWNMTKLCEEAELNIACFKKGERTLIKQVCSTM